MTNVYRHFYSLFNKEKEKLDQIIAGKQDTASEPALQTTLAVGAALLGLGLSSILLSTSEPKQKLEDHPMCGITTGGQAECYFDCELFINPNVSLPGQIVRNLECLMDCCANQKSGKCLQTNQCIISLIKDVLEDGICYFADFESPDCETDADFNPLPSCPAQYEGIFKISRECTEDESPNFCGILEGTCSSETEELLSKQECVREVFVQTGFILNTLQLLISYSCSSKVSDIYANFQSELIGLPPIRPCDPDYKYSDYDYSDKDYAYDNSKGVMEGPKKITDRLGPNQIVLQFDNFTIKTRLDYENTRHRYPWVCSLQTRGTSPEHLCAVTLLSVPPKQTIVVGAAHCTYICKNERKIAIPVCCCSNDLESCAEDKSKCGNNPLVFEMTGDDIQIRCGEWETGDIPMELSGEEYNVLLPIKEIVRHPNFNATDGAGPISGSDIAIFKVDDSSIKEKARSLRLYPICLPSSEKKNPGKQTGILAAWSKPPPFHFVEEQATGFLRFYRDFFKLWHYKVDIETCRDPISNELFGGFLLENPSNSYYPPGTVCAKDFSRQSCFSTGHSGSPLMVTERTRPMRFYAEGILSFVKGCSVFAYGPIDEFNTKWQLTQQSDNPTAYTKLSCFLPWIAEQYGMEYKESNETDPACFEGEGDSLDGDTTCRINPSSLIDFLIGEVECIFPFYYDGKRFDKCILFDVNGLINPVFRCPTRNITTKIDGINSFPVITLTEGLCPTDTDDPTSDVDPIIEDCSPFARRIVFSQCKNDCPGVRAVGLIGGGATLAFLGVTSALQSLVPAAFGVGAIGVAGLGGNMVAQMMCFTPYCRTISGRCCLLVMSFVGGPQCPDTC